MKSIPEPPVYSSLNVSGGSGRPHAVEHQHALLIGALDWHEAHARPRHRLADRFRIRGVVLPAPDIRLHVGGGIKCTVCPSRISSRAQWWAVAQASIPTRQGGSAAKNDSTWARRSRLRTMTVL